MWLLLVMLKTSNHKLEYRIGKIIFKILKIKKSIEKNIKSYNNTVNYYIYIEKNKYMLLSPKLKN
jgi:hypothetical protein